jgi:hypothetical protein
MRQQEIGVSYVKSGSLCPPRRFFDESKPALGEQDQLAFNFLSYPLGARG